MDKNINLEMENNKSEESPPPKPLTPKTYKFSTTNLCYAPKSQEIDIDIVKYKEFTKLNLST